MILSATATYFDLHISELVRQATGTVVVRADFGTERDGPYYRKKLDFSCRSVMKFYYFEEKVLFSRVNLVRKKRRKSSIR
jgi:hypothetical protein